MSHKNLAIVLEVAKRRKKKMAQGGTVSASNESRPMPETIGNDAAMVSRNSATAPLPAKAQMAVMPQTASMGPRTQRIKHPSFVQSPTFKARMRDDEDDMLASFPPMSPSARVQRYAEGGEVEEDTSSSAQDSTPKEQAPAETTAAESPTSQVEDEDKTPQDFKSGTSASAGPSVSTPTFGADAGAAPLAAGISGGETSGGGSKGGGSSAAAMADGGEVDEDKKMDDRINPKACTTIKQDSGYGAVKLCAEGGEIDDDGLDMMEDHASIVDAIMAKRKKMASGGSVDIDSNGEEMPNQYNDMNEAALKENYDEDMDDVSQPRDSNLQTRTIDHDAHDMVSAIRKRMKMRIK